MPGRLTFIFLLSMTMSFVLCTPPDTADDDEEDYDPEFRGFHEYETWKTPAQPSAPEVILIKQKDPHSDSFSSISKVIKHNLPLLAVLAPLVAVAVLLPLKAYLGPAYVVYPPVTPAPPPAPPSMRDRVGKVEDGYLVEESLATQVLNMIEEMDQVYGELSDNDKDS